MRLTALSCPLLLLLLLLLLLQQSCAGTLCLGAPADNVQKYINKNKAQWGVPANVTFQLCNMWNSSPLDQDRGGSPLPWPALACPAGGILACMTRERLIGPSVRSPPPATAGVPGESCFLNCVVQAPTCSACAPCCGG